MKTFVVGAWVLGSGVVALLLNVRSARAWALLLVVGLLPPLVPLWRWRQPASTTF